MSNSMFGFRETAEFCGVPIGTVYSWVARRAIPHIRLGKRLVRFDRRELEQWLNARRVPVRPPTAQ